MKGKVKSFDLQKGYGFIKTFDGKNSYFFHWSGIVDNAQGKMLKLAVGQEVEFELVESEKNPGMLNAINVRAINSIEETATLTPARERATAEPVDPAELEKLKLELETRRVKR